MQHEPKSNSLDRRRVRVHRKMTGPRLSLILAIMLAVVALFVQGRRATANSASPHPASPTPTFCCDTAKATHDNHTLPRPSEPLALELPSRMAGTTGDEPGWLLALPDGYPDLQSNPDLAWERIAPLFDELQEYDLLGEIARLPGSAIARAAWLSAPARQRLADAGITILPDSNDSRAQLGLAQSSAACQPSLQVTGGRSVQDVPSFVVDTTQDYVEGYLAPYARITVTLRSDNNGIKDQAIRTAGYDGQYRVCFETMNLLPGDHLDVHIEGLAPLYFAVPTLTLELDPATEQVWGITIPDNPVSVEVQDPDGSSSVLTATADSQGAYLVSFLGTRDIANGSWAQTSIQGLTGETYRVSRFLPSRLYLDALTGSGLVNLDTAGSVPARLTVRDAGGTARDTIKGTTNRIGDVCQSLQDVEMGGLVQTEVEGIVTSARLPTINANPGATQVTGTGDANADVTCALSGGYSGSVVTISDVQGTFTCDFTGVYTLAGGDRVRVTTQQAEQTAAAQTYVPVYLDVHADNGWIYAHTNSNVPVSLTIRDSEGLLRAAADGVSGLGGSFSHRADVTLQPGDVVEATSERQTATVQIPIVFFDTTANVISGTVSPNALVSVRINWGAAVETIADATGLFSMTITNTQASDGGFDSGDRVELTTSRDRNTSVSVQGYVPIRLSFYDYPSLSFRTWLGATGRWQIVDRGGDVRVSGTLTTSTIFPDEQIQPGDLISVTSQGHTATLRIPAVTADVAADTLIGLVQPEAEVDLTVSGPWGDEVTRTLTSDADGTFAANFVVDHDLLPGDAIQVQSQGPDGGYADVTYYIPTRLRIYDGQQYASVYVYTVPLTRTRVIVRDAAAQIALSETITSAFGGEVYVYVSDGLPAGGSVEVQAAGSSINYPLQTISAWVDRERDRLIGVGPPNASLMVEVGWNEQVAVQTESDGSFVLDLAGQRDLRAYSTLTVRYFDTGGIEQYYTARGPSISVNVTANTVSGSYLPPGTPVRVKNTADQVKETQTTPDDAFSSFSITFDDVSPGDTVEVDTLTGAITVPVAALSATLDKAAEQVVLSGPPGELGQLSLFYDGVRRGESYYAYSIATGDDGVLRLPLRGIYDVWGRTRLFLCLERDEGDTVCITTWSPGLTVDATYDSVSGYTTSEADVDVVVKRGMVTKGSVQLTADETGAFIIQGFCQANSPVNVTTGDQVVLDSGAASVDIVGISANLDLDADTVSGVGPAGTLLRIQFYVRRGEPLPSGGNAQGGGMCHIACQPLISNLYETASGLVQVDASGTFSASANGDLLPGDYTVITYEDDDGDLIRYVTHSTDGSGLQVALDSPPSSVDSWQTLTVTGAITGGINHDVARLYWDTESHDCDRNYHYVYDVAEEHFNSGGGGAGGGGSSTKLTATGSTYTATLAVPNADVLYLRPYAEIDGHQVWADNEVTVTINAPAAGLDAYEPDDTCAQATTISTDGATQPHAFHQINDTDWIKFDVISGTAYTVLASEVQDRADIYLTLHDVCTASPLYTDTNPLGADARIVFTPPFPGTYWARVRNYDGQHYGDQTGYNLSVRADRSQGLAIIAAGRLKMVDRLQTNINNAANQAYLTFLQRGYSREDIYYLNVWPDQDVDNNGLQDDIDDVTNVNNLRDAIQTWAQTQGVGPGVPLYIYLVDHGLVDRFYADTVNELVTAESLDLWLDNLEAATGADRITVIVETCHSGSFIDQYEESGWGLAKIAGPNRVTVSSTSSWANAWTLGDGGILFSDPFWAGMLEGRSVWGSFQAGQEAVRNAGYDDCPRPGEPGYNINCQEPWLDDNGNGIPNETDDGLLAQGRGLITPLGWEVPEIAWVHVGKVSGTGEATITAEVWDDGTLAGVEAMIIPPGYKPEDPGDGSLPEWDVPTVTLMIPGTVVYTTTYSGFQAPGNYRVVVYAWDEDGHTAVPQGVVVARSGKAVFLPLILRD